MRKAAIAGLGLARLARFHVNADIQAGLLLPVLEKYHLGDEEKYMQFLLVQAANSHHEFEYFWTI
ncbi:hypothetical protein [Photorhabdus stackebrandtii]|uniref:hypothetical protein n=1 Tax=Photorhabdus stackebrandtii TaxID=1123042 RepID=UPI001A99CAAD|nr:hypothetical protein [Photorhabdus stackebrandtii]